MPTGESKLAGPPGLCPHDAACADCAARARRAEARRSRGAPGGERNSDEFCHPMDVLRHSGTPIHASASREAVRRRRRERCRQVSGWRSRLPMEEQATVGLARWLLYPCRERVIGKSSWPKVGRAGAANGKGFHRQTAPDARNTMRR